MIELIPFKQSDSSRCGPACVRAVLAYYGIDTTEDSVARRCGWSYELGCDDFGMVTALCDFGVKAEISNRSELKDLEYWVRHHIPVIADVFVGGEIDDLPNGHSVVVVDIDREKVYVMDPAVGQVRGIARGEFERVWIDWKGNTVDNFNDILIRQIIITYPNRFSYGEEKARVV